MSDGFLRKEILYRDCPTCRGNGYVVRGGSEEACDACGGKGLLEKEVEFKFDGPRSAEELAEIWDVPASEIVDRGHAEQGPQPKAPEDAE